MGNFLGLGKQDQNPQATNLSQSRKCLTHRDHKLHIERAPLMVSVLWRIYC